MSPRSTIRALGVAVVVAATALTGVASASPTHDPIVATNNGLVRGVATGSTDQFLGIPYAAPPTGALRWQPPRPAARWHGVRDADQFGPTCAQGPDAFGGPASTAEDCLYLNVYTPARRAHGRPVMVWIHGGSLVTGAGSGYDPTGLVRDGVVVVTINYRLGALGFLAHPALGAESGDYGLMDQQAALRWVDRNIGRFGGNPDNVTIFGESAGGQSVLSQLVSPPARGLFDRAIVQSGAYAMTLPTQAEANTEGQAFAAAVGCADQSSACLRALPVTTLLANQNGLYVPNIDGRTLNQSLDTAFDAGEFARVPVVNGSTHDEWRLFVALDELRGQVVTPENYVDSIAGTLGVPAAAASAIAAEYPLSAYPSPAVALGAVGTDAIFACPGLDLSTTLSRYVPTYAYEFNDETAPELLPPVSFPQGAAHAFELPYLFTLPGGVTLTPAQQRLADDMRGYWTGFAASGAPRATGTPFWPRFTPERVQSLDLPRPHVESDFAAEHHCGFWSAVRP
jgi:para-nitrobenzyl esterase